MQSVVDDVHQQFVQAVAKGRGLSVSEVKEIADGRIMTGQQALKLKLIDEIGGLEKTLELLAKKIGVEGRPKVIEEKEKTPFFDWLLQSSLSSDPATKQSRRLPEPSRQGVLLKTVKRISRRISEVYFG